MERSLVVYLLCVLFYSGVHAINFVDIHNDTDGEVVATLAFQPPLESPWNETSNDPDLPDQQVTIPSGEHRILGSRPHTTYGKPCVSKVVIKKVSGMYKDSIQERRWEYAAVCVGTEVLYIRDNQERGGIVLDERTTHDISTTQADGKAACE